MTKWDYTNGLFVIGLLSILLASCVPPAPARISLQPCLPRGISAQCGTLSVYEDRTAQRGRKIDIHVMIIPAGQAATPAPDPIFYLAGGPGGSAIDDIVYARLVLKSAAERRALVLVDQRGTGGSNRLACPRNVAQLLGFLPVDDQAIQELRDCLAHLDADPAAYTTAWGMDDLDDVRAALGYDQINLYGESYGTTAGQVYLQRHGDHVRSMILEGTTLVDTPIFERFPRSSQEALEFLLARCRADAACHSAYPNLAAEFSAVVARLEKQPVDLPLIDPRSGSPLRLTRDALVLGIHSGLFSTEGVVQLPGMIHQAYLENWDAIAQAFAPNFSPNAPPAEWSVMNLTILCHEDWARMRRAETTQLSAGAYLGYEDVRRFTAPENVCTLIPRPRPAALYQPPASSPAPVLIINNQADPQNPSENVAGAKEHYPNSLTLIAPGQGHGYTGFACRDQIISDFIASGSTQGLNTDCLQQVPLPPFQ